MGWVIFYLILAGFICLNEWGKQQEINEAAQKMGNEVFATDEDFRNLSVEEQLKYCAEIWERGGDQFLDVYGSKAKAIFDKFVEYVREGRFSSKRYIQNENSYVTDNLNQNYSNNKYDEYYTDENVDVETGEILEAYRDSANDLDYEEYEKKIEIWNKYIELSKVKGYISPQAEGYSELANVYDDMENYEKAIEYYSKAIELKPDDKYYYDFRANMYERLGKYNKVIEDYTALIKMGAESYYYKRADYYLKLEIYEKAIDDYTSAIIAKEKEPQEIIRDNKSYSELAMYLFQFGCSNIEEYNTKFVQKYIRHYKYKRGIAYFELKMFDEAIKDFKVITDEDQDYPEAKEYLRKALLEKGNNYLENNNN